MDNFNQVKTMNLKKYIGTIIKNVEMDDLDGYFQDGAGSRFDVKVGKLVGEEIVDVEYDSAGREKYTPKYIQHVELEFLKNDEMVFTGVGFFIKQKYSRQLALTTRGLDFENKFSFYINV